jgi:hypothetical protein
MKPYPVAGVILLTGFILVISLFSCSPKCVVRGRVIDAETQQPLQGAAVAIRWYSSDADNQFEKKKTVDAVQSLTDVRGEFQIPEYPDQEYILGIYKKGYICWSSQDVFMIDPKMSRSDKYRRRKNHRIQEGMEIELEPLQQNHPRDLHAGFTVMVAGESTDTDLGPFHQAIKPEYKLWRENLRKDFQKQVGAK